VCDGGGLVGCDVRVSLKKGFVSLMMPVSDAATIKQLLVSRRYFQNDPLEPDRPDSQGLGKLILNRCRLRV
jgi:hypothetical protein